MDIHLAWKVSLCLLVMNIILIDPSKGEQCNLEAKVSELKQVARLMLKENHEKEQYAKSLMEKLNKIKRTVITKVKTLKDEIQSKRNVLNVREGSKFKHRQGSNDVQRKDIEVNVAKRSIIQKVSSRALPQNNTNTVSFTAVIDTHKENLAIHQTVRFDRLITNEGLGFDLHSSIFKAPRSGLYYFSIVMMSHSGEDIETELMKNGTPVVFTYSGDSTTWNAGPQSAVLHLNVGDNVYIRILNYPVVNDGNVRVFGYGWSTFSGFLIS